MNCKILAPLLIIYSTCTFAQSQKDQLKIANAAQPGQSEFYEEIPFIDRGGYFIIPVTIGAQTYEYIFDTGGFNTVTSEIMTKNELPELMKVVVGSINKIKSTIILSKIPALTIGNVPFTDVGVFNFDFDKSPLIKCYTNGGLVGKAIIKQAIWQIDYANKVIRVSNAIDKMPNLENSSKLKVKLSKILDPFVEIEINDRKQTFLLDFGSTELITLTEKSASEYHFSKTVESFGEGTIGANGVSAESIYISPLTSVKIAGHKFDNQVAVHAKSNNYNSIGTELAKHFIVTLNFTENELILTPHRKTLTVPFTTFGISMNSNGEQIYVSRIYKEMSGEKNGVQLNDQVVRVNDIVVDSETLCDSFHKIRDAMFKTDYLKLKVLRAGAPLDFELHAEGLK